MDREILGAAEFPGFGSGSNEITHLIHQVEDVTQAITLRQWIEEESRIVSEQRATLEHMQKRLALRQSELDSARRSLLPIAPACEPCRRSPEEIQVQLGAPETRRYLGPGTFAPIGGIYRVFHHQACRPTPDRIWMRSGQSFPRCARCRDGVLYRLLRPLL